MILEQMKEKLEELKLPVFYGIADNIMREMPWDYIVFNRLQTKPSENKTGFSHYFAVNVIRENFVPEGFDEEIIAKMREIAGMKFAGTDIQYNYVEKPNTNIVVEIMTIEFVKAVKG